MIFINIRPSTTVCLRLECLKDYGMPCPILLDTMNNEGMYEYAARREALYIIENGVVQLEGLGSRRDYDPERVRKWLENYVNRHETDTKP